MASVQALVGSRGRPKSKAGKESATKAPHTPVPTSRARPHLPPLPEGYSSMLDAEKAAFRRQNKNWQHFEKDFHEPAALPPPPARSRLPPFPQGYSSATNAERAAFRGQDKSWQQFEAEFQDMLESQSTRPIPPQIRNAQPIFVDHHTFASQAPTRTNSVQNARRDRPSFTSRTKSRTRKMDLDAQLSDTRLQGNPDKSSVVVEPKYIDRGLGVLLKDTPGAKIYRHLAKYASKFKSFVEAGDIAGNLDDANGKEDTGLESINAHLGQMMPSTPIRKIHHDTKHGITLWRQLQNTPSTAVKFAKSVCVDSFAKIEDAIMIDDLSYENPEQAEIRGRKLDLSKVVAFELVIFAGLVVIWITWILFERFLTRLFTWC